MDAKQIPCLCCCQLIDDTLDTSSHLEDCELRLLVESIHRVSEHEDGSNDNNVGRRGHPRTPSQLVRHRESMARLRQKDRDTFSALKDQELQLERQLRDAITNFAVESDSSAEQDMHQMYLGLVREEIRLREERDALEAARVLRERYEQYVTRELEKTRTFRVQSASNTD